MGRILCAEMGHGAMRLAGKGYSFREMEQSLCALLPQRETGGRPALATRFGSSNNTSIRSRPRDTCLTESASRVVGSDDVKHRHSPSSGGLLGGSSPLTRYFLLCPGTVGSARQ
jgi:hypothetical protein